MFLINGITFQTTSGKGNSFGGGHHLLQKSRRLRAKHSFTPLVKYKTLPSYDIPYRNPIAET